MTQRAFRLYHLAPRGEVGRRPGEGVRVVVTSESYFDGVPKSSSRCGLIGSLSGRNQIAGLPCSRYR